MTRNCPPRPQIMSVMHLSRFSSGRPAITTDGGRGPLAGRMTTRPICTTRRTPSCDCADTPPSSSGAGGTNSFKGTTMTWRLG